MKDQIEQLINTTAKVIDLIESDILENGCKVVYEPYYIGVATRLLTAVSNASELSEQLKKQANIETIKYLSESFGLKVKIEES